MPDDEAASARRRYHHRRPRDDAFYSGVTDTLRTRPAPDDVLEVDAEGCVVGLHAGDVLQVRQLTEPQIVLLFAWNPQDTDERIWPHETSGMENAFLVSGSRIWSTMARFRPLLTVVQDTVSVDADTSEPGRHHFVLGGFETNAVWVAAGGRASIPSGWERMRRLVVKGGGDPSTYRDHVSLFQKIAVDMDTQRIAQLPSDAVAGDVVSLFAEADLRVALLPSAYRGGGIPPSLLDGSTEPVAAETFRAIAEPLGWPYAGVPYPDLTPYVDGTGART